MERKQISAVLVRAQLPPETEGISSEDFDSRLEGIAAVIQERVERFGGTLSAQIGSVHLVLFGVRCDGPDHAERAVRAALSIREGLGGPHAQAQLGPHGAGARPTVHTAVATGEAQLRHRFGGAAPPSVIGALLQRCQRILHPIPAGEIRVCDATRFATASAIGYDRVADSPDEWRVAGILEPTGHQDLMPMVDRHHELDLLRGLLERARHHSVAHLVTVLGDPGIGKSRLMMEFERRIRAQPETAQLLMTQVAPFAGDDAMTVLARLLASYSGIAPHDPVHLAREQLTTAVRELVEDPEQAASLISGMLPLIDHELRFGDGGTRETALRAWRTFVARIAGRHPLVVVIDDLHHADDSLLNLVENVAESCGPVPLLVVVAVRTDFLLRRPEWSGGKRHATAITLGPLSDAAIDRLLEYFLYDSRIAAAESFTELRTELLSKVTGEPEESRRRIRSLLRLVPRF